MRAKVILGGLLLHVILFGGEFRLSSSFFTQLPSEKSKAIFKDYERFMNETRSKSLHVKLEMVNFYINAIVPKYDDLNYQQEDYWASRVEFLSRGGGDCEDYAIAKFYTLKDLGWDAKKMALCVVKENKERSWHMILLVTPTSKEPLVLDNLSFKVLPLRERYDLHVKECMNEEGMMKLENNAFSPNPSQRAPKSFKAMVERSKKELLWQN